MKNYELLLLSLLLVQTSFSQTIKGEITNRYGGIPLNKRFNSQLSTFFGVKNIFDYTQDSPLINPEKSFADNFETTYAYGPMQARRFVLGVSYNL